MKGLKSTLSCPKQRTEITTEWMVQVQKKVVAMIAALKSVWVSAVLMPAFIVHYKCACSA